MKICPTPVCAAQPSTTPPPYRPQLSPLPTGGQWLARSSDLTLARSLGKLPVPSHPLSHLPGALTRSADRPKSSDQSPRSPVSTPPPVTTAHCDPAGKTPLQRTPRRPPSPSPLPTFDARVRRQQPFARGICLNSLMINSSVRPYTTQGSETPISTTTSDCQGIE